MNKIAPYEDHVGLWKNELRDWIPSNIFDAHVHLGPDGIMREFSPERQREPLSTFTHLRWEELSSFYHELYSGKKISGLIACGIPLREVNLEAANAYISGLMKQEPMIKGFIISDPADTNRTIQQFTAAEKHGVRFYGVKPYFDLIGKSNYETTMPEFIPDDLLQFMNNEELIMLLHTSGLGMGTKEDQDFVRHVAEEYPKIKVILAHMGRYLDPQQFFDFMKSDILDYSQIYLEMSSASNADVYRAALSRKDVWKRLIFGSDAPFGLISGVEYNSPTTPPGLFLTRDDYSWSDPEVNRKFADLRSSLTYNTYHVIKSLKDAMETMKLDPQTCEQLKNDIFLENTSSLCSAL